MATTVDPVATEGEAPEARESESATDVLAQLGRDISALILCEAQIATYRHLPEVRRAARDVVGGFVAVLALVTAFTFLNVAAYYGLSTWLSPWLAALVLGAAWLAVGLAVLVALTVRAGRVTGWTWWRLFRRATPAEAEEELKRAREEAEATVLATLERLGPAITVELAAAVVPMASGAVEMADDVMDAAEDMVEEIAEGIPAGGVVSQMWSVFLTPGRLGLRVATTVLSSGKPEPDASPARSPSARS